MNHIKSITYVSIMFMVLLSFSGHAKTVRYELTVRNEKVNLSGKKTVDFALTVNGGIPAPTLEFTEGDDAEILVKNEIANQEVSIHWHGILLPPEEDGVAYVNTPPIHSGTSRLFKFKIRQNGTYWYHSHTGVQEQKGVYGAFIIHPKKKAIPYDRDLVVVLSDWSDENADQIMRNLRKDGDFYLYKKNSMRSYFGAAANGGLRTHLSNEWQRMGGMDLSDVGYDAFLINGKRDTQLANAKPGEKLRLRIINAAASSYFYLGMGIPMQVIAADGVDISPVLAKEVLIGMAETYDLLLNLPENKNYEFRATVQDGTGFASAWIGKGERVAAPNKEAPSLYESMDHAGHGEVEHGQHGSLGEHSQHSGHDMNHDMGHHSGHQEASEQASNHHDHSVKKTAKVDWSTQSAAMLMQNGSARKLDSQNVNQTLTVDSIEAIRSTALPKEARVHDVKLVLGGDMERYVWHINGKAIYQDRLIKINRGEVVRFTFQNDTMMHHPMHFHGHFFRVLNGRGDKSPLKHTVDVAPHSQRTIEFYANEPGQWMLHCHNLYHMKTGMARVVRYSDYRMTPEMEKLDKQDPHLHQHVYTHSKLEVASLHAKAQVRLMRTWDELDIQVSSNNTDRMNFSFKDDWESEGNIFYRRWTSNFFNIFGGASFYHEQSYGVLGIGYILPMLVESSVLVNHKGKLRLDLEKRLQWSSRIFSDIEFTWRPDWGTDQETEFHASLMYGPAWHWAAGMVFTDKNIGVGAQFQF